ncbi:MAG: HEAT repeat domain-containing protein [Planctomycetota bacterium]
MNTELGKTLELLSETANEAAVPLLLAALDSPNPCIQDGAIEALLKRRRGRGQSELIKRWHQLSEQWKQRIARHPRRIAPAVRDAILSQEGNLCANGCEAMRGIREFELIPVLVNTIEDARSPCANIVAETLIGMCELLQDDISGPGGTRRVHQPERIRERVLPSLEHAVDQHDQHRNRAVVEAFLILTHHENPLLKQIVHEPRHPAYLVALNLLRTSKRAAIIRLVLNLLESRFAFNMAVQTVSHRRDFPFVKGLLQRLASRCVDTFSGNLRRIESIEWLEDDLDLLNVFNEQEQETTVKLALASNMNRIQVFNVLRYILHYGHARGRRAAARALREFGGAEANDLALAGLRDPDPEVQANMAMQLRERGIPGAISHLIRLLDSPHESVAEAAKSCLSEFNFSRYLGVFDMMEDDARHSTGLLVRRIDPTAFDRLAEQLKSPIRTRCLRGLEISVIMNAVEFMEPLIIGLLQHDDYFIRAEAARTLTHSPSPSAQQALRQMLTDRSVLVREAAEESLQENSRAGSPRTARSSVSAMGEPAWNPFS